MAGAVQDSKLDLPVLFHEGQSASRQPGSPAGARGGGLAEARARPNDKLTGGNGAQRNCRPSAALCYNGRINPQHLLYIKCPRHNAQLNKREAV